MMRWDPCPIESDRAPAPFPGYREDGANWFAIETTRYEQEETSLNLIRKKQKPQGDDNQISTQKSN